MTLLIGWCGLTRQILLNDLSQCFCIVLLVLSRCACLLRVSPMICKKCWRCIVLTCFVLQRFSVTISEHSTVSHNTSSKPKIDCYLCQFSLMYYQFCIYKKNISKHYLLDCIAGRRVWLVLLQLYCCISAATFSLTFWYARYLVVSRITLIWVKNWWLSYLLSFEKDIRLSCVTHLWRTKPALPILLLFCYKKV